MQNSISFGLFLAGLGFWIWVLAGYPLLLIALRRRPRPAANLPAADLPAVTIVLPVRNGAAHLRRKLESLLALDYPASLRPILVVSDGSTDGTAAIAREFAGVALLEQPPLGKPAAINLALRHVRTPWIFFTDVRQPLDPACLRRLVEAASDLDVGAATGELILVDAAGSRIRQGGAYWAWEKRLRDHLNAAGALMVVTGCCFLLRRDCADPLPEDCLVDDAWLPFGAIRRGYRVAFVRGALAFDQPFAGSSDFPRKVRTLAGLYQMIRWYPWLPLPIHRHWLHYFSYKFSRLLLPYATLAMLVGALWMPRPAPAVAISAGAVAAVLLLARRTVRLPGPLARIAAIIEEFSVLMLASICAIQILFRPASALWKAPSRTHV